MIKSMEINLNASSYETENVCKYKLKTANLFEKLNNLQEKGEIKKFQKYQQMMKLKWLIRKINNRNVKEQFTI